MRQLWPDDVSRDLSDADLYDAYAPTDQERWLRTNMVASADGAATIAGRVGELTTPVDQRLLLLLRAMCDVLLVGAGTLRAEGYDSLGLTAQHLAWRRARDLAPHPVLAVVSGRLDVSPTSPALLGSQARPIVITHGTLMLRYKRQCDL